MLSFHYAFGTLVVVAALAAIFIAPARRILIYILTLQIVAGVITWATIHLSPPALHWVLALVAAGLYGVASAMERRGRPQAAVVALSIVAFVVIACTFYLGMHALQD